MLSVTWFIGPILCSVCLIYYYYIKITTVEEPSRIPEECPVAAIYYPRKQIKLVTDQKNFYQVSFRNSEQLRYWLHADEIIRICRNHKQRVPYIVGIGKERTKGVVDFGDELLIIE